MHELSISSEIVRAVIDSAEKNNGKKVLSIQMEIGELALLNVDQVFFWVRELFKGSIAEDAEMKIKMIRARFACKACGYKGGIKSDQEDPFRHVSFQTCPACHSFQVKIVKGRECTLKRIQVER
jgi:hydrogenase nickel incorporation protein HypA/HybF